MTSVLKQKQSFDWDFALEVWDNIWEYVEPAHIEDLLEKTREHIAQVVGPQHAAFGWSGGKDSLVMQLLCEPLDIRDCVWGRCDLEYPSMEDYCERNQPEGLTILNTGLDVSWLHEHPDMLFPRTTSKKTSWYRLRQWKAQAEYYKDQKLDLILMGRRKAEGNYVGRDGTGLYTKKNGTTVFCPIMDWTHEEVFGALKLHDIEEPPYFRWPRGLRLGTGPWPKIKVESDAEGWARVYEIDPSVVEDMASHFDSADAFLKGIP